MAYIKIITKAPKDVYGDEHWYLLFNGGKIMRVNPDKHHDAMYVDWSLLTDKERELVRWEWLLEEPNA